MVGGGELGLAVGVGAGGHFVLHVLCAKCYTNKV